VAKPEIVNISGEPISEERHDIPAFLRAWADRIESGEENATGALLVLHEDRGAMFRVAVRRCNMDAIRTAGALAMAQSDFCHASAE
jgi:hypothetical protein